MARGLHRFAMLLAGATFVLIFVGGLVTSTGSALSVPDWPLAFGKLIPSLQGGVRSNTAIAWLPARRLILTLALMVWAMRARAAAMGAQSGHRRVRTGHRAGGPRRHHGAVLNCRCRSRWRIPRRRRRSSAWWWRSRFSPTRGWETTPHVESRRREFRCDAGRDHDRHHLYANSRRRADAAHERGTGDSRFSAFVRTGRSAVLE